MKKHLQKLFALGFISFSITAIAQPSLTGVNTNPVIGETYSSVTTSIGVAPGSAGASQTWNLTGLGNGSIGTSTAVSVASTPSAAAFPAANIAFFDGANYGYALNTSASSLNQGSITNSVVLSYSNPETILSFPVNFNNTTNDQWQCIFTNASVTFTRNGTTTVTADGYGTVTTPVNTHNNAMRLHLVQTYTDVSTSFTLTYNNDEYIWYTPGIHGAVASTFTLTNSIMAPIYGGSYINSIATEINSFSSIVSNINLYPNPASEEINLGFIATESYKAEFKITDVTGKQLQNLPNVAILPGDNRLTLNTRELPAGIYFVGIYLDGLLQKNERFVITH